MPTAPRITGLSRTPRPGSLCPPRDKPPFSTHRFHEVALRLTPSAHGTSPYARQPGLGAFGTNQESTTHLHSGGCGTIFKISPEGVLTTLYNQCSQPNCVDSNGSNYGGVVRGADGNFYGTMAIGGSISGPQCPGGYPGAGCGTVFKVTPEGTFTTIYSFCSETNCTDGGGPFTGLVSGTEGNLYGMTSFGGANGGGPFLRSPETAR
jgi:uncharacterized repeat protein (TIGR03803 family)